MTTHKYQNLEKVDYRRALLAYLIGQGMSDGNAWAKLSPDLSVSRAGAARDIKMAEMRRWLIKRFNEDVFEEALLDEIREDVHHRPWLDLETALRDMSGGVFKSIWVFYSGDNEKPNSQVEWDWQMGNLAGNSDWLILRLLLRSKSGIGVGWGKTIAHSIVAAADRIKRKEKGRPNGRKILPIIPTVGTPPGVSHDDLEKSSTKMAASLSEAVNGTWKNVLSLENVWPVLPAGLSEDEKRGFWQAILRPGNYEAIFGHPNGFQSKTPLVRVVDTILTSAGAFHTDSYFLKELVYTGEVSKKELTRLASGDIGSALVPNKKAENDPEDKKRFDKILDLLTGIRLVHYQNIARRAAESKDPQSPAGVILCAINGNKAKIVLDLIRHQAVSTLIIDYHLVATLKGILEEERRNKQR